MKLSHFRSGDQLQAALIQQGWRKTAAPYPPQEDPDAPFFYWLENTCPHCQTKVHNICIYPQWLDLHNDLGLICYLDTDSGLITRWDMFETLVGVPFQPIDPKQAELGPLPLARLLKAWAAEWEVEL